MFSEFFIHRPKFAFVVSILMMLGGILCLSKMPISEYPEVSPPTISVRMTYAGASSEEVAEVVAAPVEEQLRRAAMITARHSVREDGCFVILAMSDGKGNIIDLTLLCADEKQAERMEKNFRENAESFYHTIIELISQP